MAALIVMVRAVDITVTMARVVVHSIVKVADLMELRLVRVTRTAKIIRVEQIVMARAVDSIAIMVRAVLIVMDRVVLIAMVRVEALIVMARAEALTVVQDLVWFLDRQQCLLTSQDNNLQKRLPSKVKSRFTIVKMQNNTMIIFLKPRKRLRLQLL